MQVGIEKNRNSVFSEYYIRKNMLLVSLQWNSNYRVNYYIILNYLMDGYF